MRQELPVKVQEMIAGYRELKLGKKEVQCPYYINISKKKDLRVMLGKGCPEEIETEAKLWEKIKKVNFESMSSQEIKKFLIDRGIGVDCSGFVLHVLNEWFKEATNKNLWADMILLRKGLRAKLGKLLRPVEQFGANTLTDLQNSVKIDVNDVRPTDVIRSKWKRQNAHHIMLVSAVERDTHNNVTKIEYIHSTPFYGETSGVRSGAIKITDPKKPLHEQEWLEVDEKGNCTTLEGFMINLEDNGIRRFKVVEHLEIN